MDECHGGVGVAAPVTQGSSVPELDQYRMATAPRIVPEARDDRCNTFSEVASLWGQPIGRMQYWPLP